MGEQADSTIQRLMRAYDVHDELTLAIKLGRDASTLRVWKSRDQVPLLILAEASKATGYSVEWLRGDEGAPESASTRTPDDDDQRLAVTERERLLIEHYRGVPEAARDAVETVAMRLADTRAGALQAIAYASADAAQCTVLFADEPSRPAWLQPVKADTTKPGGVRPGRRPALLPLGSADETRPLALSVSLGDAGKRVDYYVIPRLMGAARAGTKRKPADDDEPDDRLDMAGDAAFTHEWLRDNLGHTSGQLATVQVRGDSMEPTLPDGETIIIDTDVKRVDVAGIYVFNLRGDRMVKRIDRKLDDTLVISSDNKRYAAEKLPATRAGELQVLGRMVWPRMR